MTKKTKSKVVLSLIDIDISGYHEIATCAIH